MTIPEERIGEVFGRLTILAVESHPKGKRFRCRCSCGKEPTVWVQNVVKGRTKSCGCLYRERIANAATSSAQLIGHTFGRLTVQSVRPAALRLRTATCLCACGRHCERRVLSLVAGLTTSCGCLRSERLKVVGRRRATELATLFDYEGEQLPVAEWARRFGVSRQAIYDRIKRHGSVGLPKEAP